ncbi:hypothetical protein JW911_03270 [Candidatus Peregrinibacteria bacterium]|nr:hypothetical protein [Candidatus Peregrinibacteria bacterium]
MNSKPVPSPAPVPEGSKPLKQAPVEKPKQTETKQETKKEVTKLAASIAVPKITSFKLYGREIEKKVDPANKTVNFTIKATKEKIADLALWIAGKMNEQIKKITEDVKSFNEKLSKTQLSPDDAKKKLANFKNIPLNKRGAPKENDSIAKNASLLFKKHNPANPNEFDVDEEKTKDITVSYAEVLPPVAHILLITRKNLQTNQTEKIVCIRYGAESKRQYINAQDNKPVYLSPGDKVQIVSTAKPEEAKQKARIAAKKTKSEEYAGTAARGVRSGRGSDYSGEQYVAPPQRSSAPVSAPSSAPVLAPVSTPSSAPSLTQSPEELQNMCDQITFKNLPGRLYGSILMYKGRKTFKGPPTIITYFPGRGSYTAFEEWNKQNPGKSPPADVIAAAAREDFLSPNKNFFSMLKNEWNKGKNVVFVWIGQSRQEIGGGSTDEGAKSKHWYNTFYNSGATNQVFRQVREQLMRNVDPDNPNPPELLNNAKYIFAGHSMGGKALTGIAGLIQRGQLEINAKTSFAVLDAAYWSLSDAIKLAKQGMPLKVTYIPKTNTEAISRSVIAELKLKPHNKDGRVVFTSENYPNVEVIETSIKHSKHAGLLAEALHS